MRSCWRAPCRLFYGHSSFEADWKGEKFDKWMSHELTESKIKIVILKYHLLLLYATTMNHFSIGLWHVMKRGFYVITSSVLGPRSCKAFPKDKMALKKGHGHCLGVCFWSDPLHFSESQWNHCIWKVCSANWWDVLKTATPAAGIGQQNGPRSSPCHAWQHVTQPMLQRLNKLGYKLLPYLPDSPDLLPTDYHFFKHLNTFLQGKMLPQPAGGRKCFQWVCWILKQGFLCYRNKQTYCSLAKMCRL